MLYFVPISLFYIYTYIICFTRIIKKRRNASKMKHFLKTFGFLYLNCTHKYTMLKCLLYTCINVCCVDLWYWSFQWYKFTIFLQKTYVLTMLINVISITKSVTFKYFNAICKPLLNKILKVRPSSAETY